MLEQLGPVSLGGIVVASEEGNRAGGLSQHAAEGQCMAVGPAFVDILFGQCQSLIGMTLQPQDAGAEVLRRYPQIEREYFWLLGQYMQRGIDPVDTDPCFALVSEIMQRDGQQPV